MRANTATKTLFYCSLLSILIFLYKSLSVTYLYNSYKSYRFLSANKSLTHLKYNDFDIDEYFKGNASEDNNIKYILQWTSPTNVPFIYMGSGHQGFIERNCSFINCFVTANSSYLSDYRKFDVIAFAAPEIRLLGEFNVHNYLPKRRSMHQKYVFASIESADNYPICSNRFDGFFNWTWTYRLESEAKWGYITIRDSKNNLIGPKTDMHWIKLKDMDPVSEGVRKKIRNKTKAAAWFVSNCHTRRERELFFLQLKTWLKKYDLKIDVYGQCGTLTCAPDSEVCSKMIEEDYYFYLSFENSFAEDYVTEKLLHPLKNYAVPIVYGGANYSRFMPDGIYLNARELGAKKLAGKMNELIKNPDQYAEYFRWKKYYTYHGRFESKETDDYCRFCSMLNEEDLVKNISVYKNFKEWWNPPHRCN